MRYSRVCSQNSRCEPCRDDPRRPNPREESWLRCRASGAIDGSSPIVGHATTPSTKPRHGRGPSRHVTSRHGTTRRFRAANEPRHRRSGNPPPRAVPAIASGPETPSPTGPAAEVRNQRPPALPLRRQRRAVACQAIAMHLRCPGAPGAERRAAPHARRPAFETGLRLGGIPVLLPLNLSLSSAIRQRLREQNSGAKRRQTGASVVAALLGRFDSSTLSLSLRERWCRSVPCLQWRRSRFDPVPQCPPRHTHMPTKQSLSVSLSLSLTHSPGFSRTSRVGLSNHCLCCCFQNAETGTDKPRGPGPRRKQNQRRRGVVRCERQHFVRRSHPASGRKDPVVEKRPGL